MTKKVLKKLLDPLLGMFWRIKKKPYTIGYGYVKKKEKIKALEKSNKDLNVSNAKGLDERIVEYKWIFQHISNLKNKNLLDAGSTMNFDFILSRINSSNNITIQTLSPENQNYNKLNVSYVYEDLRNKVFHEEYFDYILCISTLEHIGFDNSLYNYTDSEMHKSEKNQNESYLETISEFKRTLKKDGKLLITIPFGKKAYFNHLQQFDSSDLKRIIKKFNPTDYKIKFSTYSKFQWVECNEEDCRESEIRVDLSKNTHDHLPSCRSICLIELIK